MLCLSGFELYSRWVPLNAWSNSFQKGAQTIITFGDLCSHSIKA